MKYVTNFVLTTILLGLLIPGLTAQPQRNNDWYLRQQQQQQLQRQQAEQMRRQQMERQRQEDLRRRQQLDAQQREQQRRMQALQQQRIQDLHRQRLLNAQQTARLSVRQQEALRKQQTDRLTFSNGVAKLNKPPTNAEMKRGFTGRVKDGRAIVKVRGKVYVVPASRIGVKRTQANDNAVTAAGAGGQRPSGGANWDEKKRSAMLVKVQQLAALNWSGSAKARARILANGGGKQPPDGGARNGDGGGGPDRVAANDNQPIRIDPRDFEHVVKRHTQGGAESKNASVFNQGEDLLALAQRANGMSGGTQRGGNIERTVDAGRPIGIIRLTGKPTSVYTVITRPGNNTLVTMFPGRPED